jgi:hypothetical protein
MRGSADARSRQYFSFFAVFSARDPGDATARKSVFGMFRPVNVSVSRIRLSDWFHPGENIRIFV